MSVSSDSARTGDWSVLFRILAKGAEVTPSPEMDFVFLGTDKGRVKVPVADLVLLAGKGLVRRTNGKLFLTEAGENLVSGSANSSVEIDRAEVTKPFVARNEDESPLSTLRRHKGVDGLPFLSERQFGAGERLRADFTRGQLSPRMSANWQTSVASNRRSCGAGGLDDLTNSAIVARQRFEAALDSMGPDLCGAVMDVCCFLKGLEQVEIERRWPRRAAKFMLRAGLTLLAMHYDPEPKAKTGRLHRWGAQDYRPVIK